MGPISKKKKPKFGIKYSFISYTQVAGERGEDENNNKKTPVE